MKDKFTFECYLTDKDGNLVGDSYKDTSGYSTEWDCQDEAIIQARELFDFHKNNDYVKGVEVDILKNGELFKVLEMDSIGGGLHVSKGIHVGDSRVSDSVNADEFLANFEPYIVSEEQGDDYDEADYRGAAPSSSIDLVIGDNNSDVKIVVRVFNISEYGDFDFDIDDVYNDSEGTLFEIMGVDDLYEVIDDFIREEVVFDETH